MRCPARWTVRWWSGLLLALSACGGGGGGAEGGASPPTISRTLAYVVNTCHEDAASASLHQSLQVRRGERAPVTVAEITGFFPPLGLCPLYAQSRLGVAATLVGAFQRIGLSPDQSGLVFEITFDYSILLPLGFQSPLRPDQQGIFYVRTDGTGLRRLGDASRVPDAAISPAFPTPSGNTVYFGTWYPFSPDGRLIAFTDIGPGPEGDAIQIVTLDLTTGVRKQLTHLPATAPPDVRGRPTPATTLGWFPDNETIVFWSRTNPDGLNPTYSFPGFTINTDGTDLKLYLPPIFPGGQVVQNFSIIPSESTPLTLYDLRVPVNPRPDWGFPTVQELYSLAGDNLLQLTNFRRVETAASGVLSLDRQRVFFNASADPLGLNPTENCQVFSIDTLGRDLRQLTHFRAVEHSEIGCIEAPAAGCCVQLAGQDRETESLLLVSTCDPLGTNPNGVQYFVMRPDGTGLRQLTDLRGVVIAPDGSIDVELPGPELF